jgi:hypothetical protein
MFKGNHRRHPVEKTNVGVSDFQRFKSAIRQYDVGLRRNISSVALVSRAGQAMLQVGTDMARAGVLGSNLSQFGDTGIQHPGISRFEAM